MEFGLYLLICGSVIGVWWFIMTLSIKGWLPVFGQTSNRTVQVVVDLLEKSDDWVTDQHRAKHPVGVSIWISSGRAYCRFEVDEREIKISAVDRNRVWNAFKRLGNTTADHTALLLANRIIERYGNEKVVPIGRLRA